MKAVQKLIDQRETLSNAEKETILNEAFDFYQQNFDVSGHDSYIEVAEKIADTELLDHYIHLLFLKSETTTIADQEELKKALDLIDYLEKTNTTYSWDRTVLREDILRVLAQNQDHN